MNTKTLKYIGLAFSLALGIQVYGQNRNLVWEENFDGDKLNEESWNYIEGDGCPNLCGWGNNERQTYLADNIHLEDGFLVITARKDGTEYTSGRISTKGKREFKYGRMEARIQLPPGNGLWAAFWMLGSNIDKVGWPRCGEIDILEYVGREPGSLFTTLHTSDSFGNSMNTRKAPMEGIEEGFHTYALEWTDSKISFFVDDEHFYTFAPGTKKEKIWPFDQPFYFILNLAIGGNFGGDVIDDSALPSQYLIDYIRVYQD